MFEKINSSGNEEGGNLEEKEKLESAIEGLDVISKNTDYSAIRSWLKRIALIGISSYAIFLGTETIESFKEYDDYKNKIIEESGKNFEEEKKFVIQEIGEENFSEIERADRGAFFQKDEERKDPEIQDAEKSGFSQKIIEGIIEDGNFFPSNYIKGEVDKIIFGTNPRSTNDYGIDGVSIADANRKYEILQFNFDSSKGISDNSSKYNFFEVNFAHEITHLNDWMSDQDLNIVERVNLLGDVIRLMNKENCLRGFLEESYGRKGYHQRISKGNKEDETYLKATEYFAEMGESYFVFTRFLKEEHPDEFELFDKYIKKNDPKFDPFEAGSRRIEFVMDQARN